MKLSARELELKAWRVAEAERQEKLLAAARRKPVSSRVSSEPPVSSPVSSVSSDPAPAVSSQPVKTDRVAYMRDLMRRKRAADRALKQAERVNGGEAIR
jgi:hypothetical protein